MIGPEVDMQKVDHQIRQRDRLILAVLIFLSLVPAAAGIYRVISLAAGAAVTEENARFHSAPFPVVVHILSSLVYCLLGAFQFAPGFRANHRSWHRKSGRVIAAAGLASALTGLWMTLYYPAAANDGPALYYIRLIVAPAMVFSLLMGIYAATQKKLQSHGAWMLRAYALGLGAGTQVFTHVGYMLLVATPTGPSRDAMMALGWLINAAVAEWIFRRKFRNSIHTSDHGLSSVKTS